MLHILEGRTMADNLNIEACLQKLADIDLPLEEKGQLVDLVRDYGYLGARQYLLPRKITCVGERDQAMADRHRAILEGL